MMKVLFVCLGNICRSPLAMGILRDKAREQGVEIEVGSAGFEDYHVGEGADPRSRQIASKHGIDISDHIARQFRISDFDYYDRIYVMDSTNHQDVMSVARNGPDEEKVDYILNLVHPGRNLPVPDPYYGGKDGFENIFRLLDQACDRLLSKITSGGNSKSMIK
jgi:protein-tyrosine phosphatase